MVHQTDYMSQGRSVFSGIFLYDRNKIIPPLFLYQFFHFTAIHDPVKISGCLYRCRIGKRCTHAGRHILYITTSFRDPQHIRNQRIICFTNMYPVNAYKVGHYRSMHPVCNNKPAGFTDLSKNIQCIFSKLSQMDPYRPLICINKF